jgi:hypothetical protein
MLPLVSSARAMRSGRRSALKSDRPGLAVVEGSGSPGPADLTGRPSLSSTETGTRTVRVTAAKVGPMGRP